MFERLQKPFLTVETGEAYQPVRLTYCIKDKAKLLERLDHLKCLEKNLAGTSWNWLWQEEATELILASINSFQPNPHRALRIGTLTLRNELLYLHLPSFKRACLAAPFFHRLISPAIAHVEHADFINKVFAVDERLPHGFSEFLKEEELEEVIRTRISDYQEVLTQCEEAPTAEEALHILSEYNDREGKKRLPYAERYEFDYSDLQNIEVVFLGFYIFLRSRELIAIRRWHGETGYTISNVTDEMIEKIFGTVDTSTLE